MSKHKKLSKFAAILSTISNTAIFALVVFGVVIGIKEKIVKGEEPWYYFFFYFTTLSNLFLGVASAIMAVYSAIAIKTDKLPRPVTNIKYVSTVATTLTLTTVFVVFIAIMGAKPIDVLSGANLFFHLIIPVLGLISVTVFEQYNKIKFRTVFLALVPAVVYGIIYGLGYYFKWEFFKDDPYAFVGMHPLVASLVVFSILFVVATIVWGLCRIISVDDAKIEDEQKEEEEKVLDEIEDIESIIEKEKAKEERELKKKEKPSKKSTSKKEPKAKKVEEKEQPVVKEPTKEVKEDKPAKEEKKAKKQPKKESSKQVEKEEEKEAVRTYHIAKAKDGKKWQVKLAKGQKAIKIFDTQAEAIEYAKKLVETQGGSIRIHSRKGSIRKE